MGVQVFMDWKGNPINKDRHGGAKAALFICFMVLMTNMSYAPTFLNLVTYLRGTMHMDVATVTNFFGFCDAYIASISSISKTTNMRRYNYFWFWATKPVDDDDDVDDDDIINMCRRRKSSYFNWMNICISGGSVMGLTLIVWIESSKGWTLGLALTSAVMLLGLVLVATFRKRNLPSPENEAELYQESPGEEKIGEILSQTKSLKFLDKAAILNGSTTGNINNNWSLCTVTQVEGMKIIIRMVPIFLSALLAYIHVPQLLTFTIQQGSNMNAKLASGNINVSPVSLLTIPIFFQTIFLILYDGLFVPIASKITGHRTGITHLQRVGVGFVMVSLAGTIAALIERKRKIIVAAGAGDHVVPMSVLWLGFQFFAIVIIDVFTYVGLLEFFNGEASRGMNDKILDLSPQNRFSR
ncbi:protein NRT1/ PTR FAMILY 4.3-like [Telopea speciosissima]|uniref:protein NRT1/ PTR FAMILY 4.3-like n=1 Tax=Telopea speciosissima TaxID=54955 RepID=UPI001CC34EA5|nr:protein NRT1/ PTR FAMILY 4.3-like [Telopea speciosissima]